MKLPKSLMKVLFPKKKKSSSSSKSAPPPPSPSPSRTSNVGSKNAAPRGYNQVLDNGSSSSSPSSSPRTSPPGTPPRAATSTTPSSQRRGKKQKQPTAAVTQQQAPPQQEEYFPKEQQHNDYLQLRVVDSNDKNSPVTVATTLTCASRASSSPEDYLIRRNSSSSSSNDDDLDEKRGVEFEREGGDNDNDVGDSSADISPIAKSALTFESEAAVDGPSFPTLQGSNNIIESGDDNDNDDSLQENHQASEEEDVQEDVVVMMTPAKTSAFNVIGGVDDPVEENTKPQDAVAVSVDATEDDTAALANAADIPASTNTTDKAEEPPNSPTTSTTSPSTTSASSPQQQTTSTSTKKVQFSLRGEEARQRAIARQKKILSKASLRLDAISDTSLENIEEAVANSSNAANKKEEDSPSGKEDEESISTGMGNDDGLVVGDISSVAAVTSAEEDGKSIKSIVSHQVLGEGNGAMSSILFYESSPTNRMIKKKDEEDAEGEDVAEQEIRQVSSGENNEEEQGGDFEQKKETSPLQELMSDNSLSPDSKETSPTTTKPKEKNMHFFILLLCPTSRIFELVEISNAKPHSTIQDILNVIPLQCTDERLLSMKYMGFVRPSDRMEFSDLDKRAFEIVEEQRDFWEKKEQQQQQQQQNGDGNNKEDDGWGDEREDWPTSLNTIREDDVLVAILDGYSGYQMSKISKPILRNAKFRDMIRRRSRRSKKKRGHHGSSSSSHHFDKDDSRSLKSNKSRSSRNSSSRRRKSGGGSSSKKGRNGSVSSSSRSKRHHPKRSSGTPPMFEIDTETNKTPKNTKASNDKSSSSSSKDHPEKGASSTNNERYSTLCQRLEHLSKKLHDVDDEIMAGGVDDDDLSLTSGKLPTIAGSPSRPEKSASTDTIDDCENIDGTEVKNNGIPEEVQGIPEVNFKMTSKMVAYELAANIEDIFADHNVEIVAVDADPDDSDDDTFVSARSMRSLRSVRSVRSLVQGFDVGHGLNDRKGEDGDDDNKNQQQQPLFEITTKSKRRKRKPRQKFDMFESGEEDDMMLQIEAMAKQADAAFESRKKSVVPGTAIIEPKIEPIENKTNGQKYLGKEEESEDDTQELETGKSEAMAGDGGNDVEEEEVIQTMASVDEEIDLTPDDVLGAIGKSIGSKGSTVNESAISTAKPAAAQSSSQSDALSRNFLNASTSMVSTMVAASQGRINEVHVLQYLGVTIVCIAANFLQKTGAASKNNTSPGGVAKEVFQSAMFLAFMVNGQRYLAKVTKKGGSA